MPEIGALLGAGLVAEVHAYGEMALKRYPPGRKDQAFLEAAILAVVEGHGLPAPRVHETGQYEGRWGLVMDRAAGETLGARVRADASLGESALAEVVRLQLLVHAVVETRLRPLKARLAGNIDRTPLLGRDDKRRLQESLAALPDGDRICHGDFHPLNIVGEPGASMIIDWLDATTGPPAADACRSYLLLRLGAAAYAEAYLGLYAARSGVDREAILAWLPCIAAARLAEGAGDDEFLIELAKSS